LRIDLKFCVRPPLRDHHIRDKRFYWPPSLFWGTVTFDPVVHEHTETSRLPNGIKEQTVTLARNPTNKPIVIRGWYEGMNVACTTGQ
jgi:hypothetical protein